MREMLDEGLSPGLWVHRVSHKGRHQGSTQGPGPWGAGLSCSEHRASPGFVHPLSALVVDS